MKTKDRTAARVGLDVNGQLGHDVRRVGLDRLGASVQGGGDLLDGQPQGQKLGHLELPWRKTVAQTQRRLDQVGRNLEHGLILLLVGEKPITGDHRADCMPDFFQALIFRDVSERARIPCPLHVTTVPVARVKEHFGVGLLRPKGCYGGEAGFVIRDIYFGKGDIWFEPSRQRHRRPGTRSLSDDAYVRRRGEGATQSGVDHRERIDVENTDEFAHTYSHPRRRTAVAQPHLSPRRRTRAPQPRRNRDPLQEPDARSVA